ncbi:MAG: PspC domain-containing protein, partial [Acidimicrobiales bacterium]
HSSPNTEQRLELGAEGKIGGVCDGIANYFGVDVTIIRIVAVVAIFMTAGFTVLVYLVAWVVMPKNSGQPIRPRARKPSTEHYKMLAWGLIAIGILIAIPQLRWFGISAIPLAMIGGGVYLLTRSPNDEESLRSDDRLTDSSPKRSQDSPTDQLPAIQPATTTSKTTTQQTTTTENLEEEKLDSGLPITPFVLSTLSVVLGVGLLGHLNDWWSLSLGQAFASVLLASGAGLVVAAFTGRAPGLIVLGMIAALGLASAWILDPIIQDGAGQSIEKVSRIEELEPEYRLGAGELILDLRGLDLKGTEQSVKAHLETGSLKVLVPKGVDLVLSAKALAGEVTIGNESDDGYRAELFREIDTVGDSQLTVDAEVTFGEVIVSVGEVVVYR